MKQSLTNVRLFLRSAENAFKATVNICACEMILQKTVLFSMGNYILQEILMMLVEIINVQSNLNV